jgi:hypothetical protein
MAGIRRSWAARGFAHDEWVIRWSWLPLAAARSRGRSIEYAVITIDRMLPRGFPFPFNKKALDASAFFVRR